MNKTLHRNISKVLFGGVGLAVAFMMVFGSVLPAQADSKAETAAKIEALIEQIQKLNTQLEALRGDSDVSIGIDYYFRSDLSQGSTGIAVLKLQEALNENPATRLTAVGPGSPGNETSYYGVLTQGAVKRFQEKYAGEILYPLGLTSGTGYFGPSSRAKMNEIIKADGVAGDDADKENDSDNDDKDDKDENKLEGGEASIRSFELMSGVDYEVAEGESAKVAETEFSVKNGDVEIKRVDVSFKHDASNSTDRSDDEPWDVFRSVSILMDGEEIAKADADRENDWLSDDPDSEGRYTIRLGNIDTIVKEGKAAEMTIVVTAQNSVDGVRDGDVKWILSIENRGIRAGDGIGLQHYIGNDSDEVTFDVVSESDGDDLDLSVAKSNPEGETLLVHEKKKSDPHMVLAFDLETGQNDVTIDEININATTSDNRYKDVVSSATLEIDGEEFRTNRVKIGEDESTATLRFDLNNFEVDGDETVTAKLWVTFKPTGEDGRAYATTGTTITTSVDGSNVRAEGARDISVDGKVKGDIFTLSIVGTDVDVKSAESKQNRNGTVGSFTYKFTVEATEADVRVDADDFTRNIIGGPEGATLDVNTTLISTNADADMDNGGTGNAYIVRAGDTNSFTLTYTVDPDASGTYYVTLEKVAGENVNKLAGPEVLSAS